jgi:hypothetical protein
VDQLRIDEIVQRIDSSLGQELPFSARTLSQEDLAVLRRLFGDVGYQDYLDDQTNRQIIRVYLTNAVVLGYLPEKKIEAYSRQVETREGRAALSLHILMSSVEDAANLPMNEELQNLHPEPGSPPHLTVIRN